MKKIVMIMKLICLSIICGLFLMGCGNSNMSAEVAKEVEEIYAEFSWPKSDIAALIPVPKSNIGKISWEASYGFVIYVAETPEADFNAYADACYDKGFNVNYRRGDNFFYADNESGYHLSLKFEEGNVMWIRMDEPDDIEEENLDSNTGTENTEEIENGDETEEPQTETVDGIRPEFKEFLDSYEAYMDEYCEFMKKYADSNNDPAMLGDYANLMVKYAEFAEKVDDLENEEMSDEEAKYYTEVMLRVQQKLLEVAQ